MTELILRRHEAVAWKAKCARALNDAGHALRPYRTEKAEIEGFIRTYAAHVDPDRRAYRISLPALRQCLPMYEQLRLLSEKWAPQKAAEMEARRLLKDAEREVIAIDGEIKLISKKLKPNSQPDLLEVVGND